MSYIEKSEDVAETILLALRVHARMHGDKIIYSFLDSDEVCQTVTYSDLDESARCIARELLKYALRGDRALLIYSSGLEFIKAFLGCLYAGVVAVPSYVPKKNRNAERVLAIAHNCKPKLLLCTSETRRKLVGEFAAAVSESQIFVTDAADWQKGTTCVDNSGLPVIRPEDLAFLQYTSGSTADPKGVMVTHGNIVANAQLIRNYFDFNDASVMISWLPMFHDMGLMGGVLAPLFVGFPSVLMAPNTFLREPVTWLRAVTKFRGTCMGAPNFAYDLCVRKITAKQKLQLDLSTLSIAYSGSEPVRAETLDQFSAAFATCGFHPDMFLPCYGMAETTLLVSGGPPLCDKKIIMLDSSALSQHRVLESSTGKKIVSCGQIGSDQEVRIVHSETGIECIGNEVGEVWVTGKSVTQGYFCRPEETNDRFYGKLRGDNCLWLRTGDYGFLRDGQLFITGRLKDVIIIRGRNIYPEDIERIVENHFAFVGPNACAAFSLDRNGEEQLMVVAESSREMARFFRAEISLSIGTGQLRQAFNNLRTAITEKLDVALSELVFVRPTTFPRTSAGKVQRYLCASQCNSGSLDVVAKFTAHTAQSIETIPLVTTSKSSLVCVPMTNLGKSRIIAYATVFTPFAITIFAAFFATGGSERALLVLAACCVMYLVSMLGISVGFHRLFTHNSFHASQIASMILGISGSMAAQGPLLFWVATHRKHHAFSDEPGKDPHTPFEHGMTYYGRVRGFVHAHLGWMLSPEKVDYNRYCPDLLRDPNIRFVNKYYWTWVIAGILLPGLLLAFTLPFDPILVLHGCIWGGPVRIFLGHHSIWAVNSICHLVGYRSFDTQDQSRNNSVVALLTCGEGWHNNHHAIPTNARFGRKWYEFDVGYLFIKALKSLGHARDIKARAATYCIVENSTSSVKTSSQVSDLSRARLPVFLRGLGNEIETKLLPQTTQLTAGTSLTDLAPDSLHAAELCIAVEKLTGVRIDAAILSNHRTLGDLWNHVFPALNASVVAGEILPEQEETATICNLRTNNSVRIELDGCLKIIDSQPVGAFVRLSELVSNERQRLTRNEWHAFVQLLRTHPIFNLVHKDPLTFRCFQKPRGYSGDAELMDFIYEKNMPVLENADEMKKLMFDWTINCSAPNAVRQRRNRIAKEIDYTSSVKANSKVLSVACGHFREIELTSASKECRFFLLDQDRESLSTAVNEHGSQFDLTPINMSIEEYVNGKPLYGKFDLIYSAGLFDYLDQEQACRIFDFLFDQLLPSGRVIIANFSDTLKDAAFMECFMDWWLEYRNQTQMLDLAKIIAKEHIAKICIDSGEAGDIGYLTIVRY